MIPEYDDLERCNVELYKLIEHVTSGAKDNYYVYAPSGGLGQCYTDYQEALKAFNAITEKGYSFISLATRIGTQVAVLSKVIE